MNVLIIGGTGVLSSAVTAESLRKGIEVTLINRGNRRIPEGVELIKSDKDDLGYISKMLEGRRFDAVMDYLCYTDEATRKSVQFYSKYTNQYFFISSCAVYDTKALNGDQGDEESSKPLTIWDYSVNKWESEKLLVSLLKDSATNYTIIRPCVTYDNTRIPYGITPQYGYHWTLVSRIKSGKPIITWNGGSNRCNMMRVEDFAVGVVGLIGNAKAYNEAFNVCGDEVPTFKEVLECIECIIGVKAKTIDISSEFYAQEIPSRKGEILGGRSIDSVNSNRKVKEAVPSFKQKIPLKEGVKMTLKTYENNNFQKGIDWQFDGDCDRVIHKWIELKSLQPDNSLGFVNYFGNASFVDKLTYWGSYRKDTIAAKIVMCIIRYCQRFSRLMKRTTLKFKR